MLICPKCKQEYDEGMTDCADCLVPLKSALDAQETGPGAEKMEAAVFRGESEEALDLMLRAVAVHHIPTKCASEVPGLEMKGHLMLVPSLMGDKVQKILDHGVQMLIGDGEGEGRVYRIYKQSRENEIRDPELLRRSIDSLAAGGQEVMDDLLEIVVRGDAAARHRAAYALSCMGEEGTDALIHLLRVAVEKEQQEVATSLIRVIRDEVESAGGWEEIYGCMHSNLSRILALQAIAVLGDLSAFPSVLAMLEDENSEVRDEADNVLCILTDEDMGFDTDAPEDERRAVAGKWEEWWAKYSGRKDG